jgi:hypothetical protein
VRIVAVKLANLLHHLYRPLVAISVLMRVLQSTLCVRARPALRKCERVVVRAEPSEEWPTPKETLTVTAEAVPEEPLAQEVCEFVLRNVTSTIAFSLDVLTWATSSRESCGRWMFPSELKHVLDLHTDDAMP